MSKIINKVATALVYHLEWPAVTGSEVEAKELCSRFTVQSIANIGFGFEANTFNAAQTLEFFNMTKRIMPREYRFDMWEVAKWLLVTRAFHEQERLRTSAASAASPTSGLTPVSLETRGRAAPRATAGAAAGAAAADPRSLHGSPKDIHSFLILNWQISWRPRT